MINWDKIKAPAVAISAITVTCTILYGYGQSVSRWNTSARATDSLIVAVDNLKTEIRKKQSPDPRVDTIINTLPVIIEVVSETQTDVHNIKTELSAHLGKSMSADEWRKLMNEFFKPELSDSITWHYKKLK